MCIYKLEYYIVTARWPRGDHENNIPYIKFYRNIKQEHNNDFPQHSIF